MTRRDFTARPIGAFNPNSCSLVDVQDGLKPLLLRALENAKSSATFAAGLHSFGINECSRLQWEIAMSSTQRIVDAVDRIYRLFDSSVNGNSYALLPDGTPAPLPVLPSAYNQSVAGPAFALRSIVSEERSRWQKHETEYLMPDALWQEAQYNRLSEILTELQAIRAASNAEQLDDIIGQLTAILALL